MSISEGKHVAGRAQSVVGDTSVKGTVNVAQGVVRGLLLNAAKGEIRYYLNGVCVDFDHKTLVATDGHAALIYLAADGELDGAKGTAIVPREALEDLIKGPKGNGADQRVITIEIDGLACKLKLLDTVKEAKCIDGRYPDYLRVIPKETSGKVGQFDPALHERVVRGIELITQISPEKMSRGLPVQHNGETAAAIIVAAQAIGVIMPWRTADADPVDWKRLGGAPVVEPKKEKPETKRVPRPRKAGQIHKRRAA